MVKVLVVGQTPPPYGGQAMMIQSLLNGKFKDVKLYHARMAFSKEMSDMGRIQILKIFHLVSVILNIIYMRVRYRPQVLYYPPSGPDRIPLYRDMIILIFTRWMFAKTIFHFHAAGVSEYYHKMSPIARFLFRLSHFNVDVAIRLSEHNPEDGRDLLAKTEVIIPNGIPDDASYCQKPFGRSSVCEILFVGFVRESKGVRVLVDAANLLKTRGLDFHLTVMGRFISQEFEDSLMDQIGRESLSEHISFPGVLTGSDKLGKYASADIFCFPTFFESESFGLVVAEAMQFSLPVVATKWRGVQSLVDDGSSGYLVPIKDCRALADRLEILIRDPDLRKRMGLKGREIFSKNYTTEKFVENMENCFVSLIR